MSVQSQARKPICAALNVLPHRAGPYRCFRKEEMNATGRWSKECGLSCRLNDGGLPIFEDVVQEHRPILRDRCGSADALV